MIKFGPSGNGEDFYSKGYKHSYQMPEYLATMGLTAYEYSCSRGVNIKKETAILLGEKAKEYGISLSIHAPYYISLAAEGEALEKSMEHIRKTLECASYMGAIGIVVHSGSLLKMQRQDALIKVGKALERAVRLDNSDVYIYPETMGKINQLGDLSEVLDFCGISERLLPCVDFGHLNARTLGGLRTAHDFENVFDQIESRLGEERARKIHCHYSRIEFTIPGGEKKHHTYADRQYGPDFLPIAEIMKKRGYRSTIICESKDTMALDAAIMKEEYESLSN